MRMPKFAHCGVTAMPTTMRAQVAASSIPRRRSSYRGMKVCASRSVNAANLLDSARLQAASPRLHLLVCEESTSSSTALSPGSR